MDATSIVTLAARRIEAGALNTGSVDELAAAFGLTARHLRRLMREELGIAPLELAQSSRLALARQLVEDPRLSMIEVALAAGFGSLRRFNAAFADRFGQAPRGLSGTRAPPGEWVTLQLPASVRWEGLALRRIAGVEVVGEGTFARTARLGPHTGWLAVYPGSRKGIVIEVSLTLLPALVPAVAGVRERLAGRSFDALEGACCALLGVRGAARIARVLGQPFHHPHAPMTRVFPTLSELTAASPADRARAGIHDLDRLAEAAGKEEPWLQARSSGSTPPSSSATRARR